MDVQAAGGGQAGVSSALADGTFDLEAQPTTPSAAAGGAAAAHDVELEAASWRRRLPAASGATAPLAAVGGGASSPQSPVFGAEPPTRGWRAWCNVSTATNVGCILTFVLGLVLVLVGEGAAKESGKWVLSAGLFGLAGAITNWIAVQLIFEKVPFLYGSGVIPAKFREIRFAIKHAILASFFDEEFLGDYLRRKAPEVLQALDLEGKLGSLLEGEEVEGVVRAQLEAAAAKGDELAGILTTAAMMLSGGDVGALAPHLMPLVQEFGRDMASKFVGNFDPTQSLDVPALRAQLDQMLTEKLEQLTADRVKAIIENVIREHLGWLVVWGGVFGGTIGLVAQAAGFGM